MLNPNQEIVNYFLEKTGKKATGKAYIGYMSQAKALFKAGYTEMDIKLTIDYLVEHPPKNGFGSLGFVQYVIDDTLAKIKVQQYKAVETFFDSSKIEEVKEDNVKKFNMQNKPVIKGQVKF